MTDTERYEYIIYKICSDECGEFYIGSTRNMVQRKKTHKSCCNSPNNPKYNQKLYKTIRDNGGWDAFRMVPLEKMENATKFEAECREEVVRYDLNAKLNSQRASCFGISVQEYMKDYYQENKDHLKEYVKEYREERKEYYKKYNQKYNQENKDQIREQNKKYYEENIEQITAKQKIYNEENKEKIRLQKNQKCECQCGGKYTNAGKSQHLRTEKHQLYLENLEKET